ncbi:hypothetical protein PVK06_030452 [Gossypium arboreum]|uniref:Uncharacterized protein n=1 Tax=Gossypium arboreum TaxID=29729 RepID=A0ABR0NNC1_GOSAR|nr:hypothetical protein PVK06_030452 [Gossypium arboreum]
MLVLLFTMMATSVTLKIALFVYRRAQCDRYDSSDIKGPRSLEAIVQIHLASGSPYLELYVQFSSPNDAFATSTSNVVREEYTTPTRHSVSGWQNMKAPVFGSSMKYTTPARHSIGGWDMYLGGSMFDTGNTRDDVLPTTSTGKGTSFVADDGGLDNESNVDPLREPDPDDAEVGLFFEPEPIPTIPEDVEGDSNEEEEDP